MNRYQLLFDRLKGERRGAFVPFVTLGDPTPEISFSIIKNLIDAGADCLELGFPYSDPIADGPVIQAASIRALEAGVTMDNCFALLARIREYYEDIPIGLLTYSNLILAKGINAFYEQAFTVGVDSVLIADVPTRESQLFYSAALQHNISHIFIVPPNITKDNLEYIARHSDGYTYLLSRAGVTGVETQAQMPAEQLVEKLAFYNAAPPLLGFGISEPQQVEDAINAGAIGVIVGSAVVKRVASNLGDHEQMMLSLQEFVVSMKSATYYSQQESVLA
ncbi:MAG: tryptophan synthase subunit alpha [Cellvibrionaceae bacterium]